MVRRLAGILSIVALLLAGACGGDDDDSNAEEATEDTSTDDEATDDEATEDEATDDTLDESVEEELTPEEEAFLEEFTSDIDAALEINDLYWATHWGDFFTGEYVSPSIYGAYVGEENPPCGADTEPLPENAYYCPDEDYIAYDVAWFVEMFDDSVVGDAFVYFVLSHEWGHAIQARLDETLQSQSAELQADCLAAAVLSGSVVDGTLEIEPGDRGEIFTALALAVDEYEWGDPAAHGSADERIEAYQLGESGGVAACLPEEVSG